MRRKRHEGHPNHERWLVSYADFITLLFAFFVVLYASSKADLRKQQQFAQSIHSAFTALGLFPENGRGKGPVPEANPPADTALSTQENLEKMREQLQKKLAAQIAAHQVALQLGPDGLVISLREAGFYESGSATPKPSSMGAVGIIAHQLYQVPYALRIEGHTDNVPIHTAKFDSNWELSTARATTMARLLIENFGIAPQRLSAAGYAQYHPIASNATAAGRAENRRVDIIVLPHLSVADSFGGTAPPPADGKPSPDVGPAPK
jgi:chemotaxis protein MotB